MENLLFESYLSNTNGFEKLHSNDAALANYGHELALNVRPLSPSSPITWVMTLIGAYNKDVLLKLPSVYRGQFINWDDNTDQLHMVNRVGTSSLSNYLLQNVGVYATDDEVPVDPVTGLRYRTADGTFFKPETPYLLTETVIMSLINSTIRGPVTRSPCGLAVYKLLCNTKIFNSR